jgi:hypothetical protein
MRPPLLILFLFFLPGFFLTPLRAQHDKCHHEIPETPGMVVTPWHLDFGRVCDGEEPMRTVTIANTSDKPLALRRIYSGCGCAVPRVIFAGGVERDVAGQDVRDHIGLIEPGTEARIEVRFVTHGYHGILNKHIEIRTDHPTVQNFKVCVAAEIFKAILLDPKVVDFGEVVRGRRVEKEVLLTSEGIGKFEVTGIENLEAYMGYSLGVPPPVRERETKNCVRRLRIFLHGDVPLGMSKRILLVRISHDRVKTLRIPVKMNVQPKVVFRKGGKNLGRNLDFGLFPGKDGKTLTVEITNLVPAIPYQLLDVSLDRALAKIADVRTITVEEGVRYKLEIRLRPGIPPGYARGTISILSDHPDMMRKTIRILGYAAGP